MHWYIFGNKKKYGIFLVVSKNLVYFWQLIFDLVDFLGLGYGQEYGFGHTGTRPVLPYYGYSGKMETSHTVARILQGCLVSHVFSVFSLSSVVVISLLSVIYS